MTIAKVLKNRPADQNALVQPHKAVWRQVRVCHLPLYTTEEGDVTIEPTDKVLEEAVRHSAMVLQVELLVGGELTHGCSRTLSDNGWGLLLDDAELVAHCRACVDELVFRASNTRSEFPTPDAGGLLEDRICDDAGVTPHVAENPAPSLLRSQLGPASCDSLAQQKGSRSTSDNLLYSPCSWERELPSLKSFADACSSPWGLAHWGFVRLLESLRNFH